MADSKAMKAFKIISISIIIIIIGIWLVFSFYLAHKPKPSFIQGQIEATQYSISSKVAGRINEIFVKKGDLIKEGDLAYTIFSPELDAKIKTAALDLIKKFGADAHEKP